MPSLDWNVNKSRHILEENWQLEEYFEVMYKKGKRIRVKI